MAELRDTSRCTPENSRSGEGLRTLLGKPLLRLLGLLVLLLRDSALLLAEYELDVARARHVWVRAAVRTVCPPALLLRAIHLDMEDLEVFRVEALNLSIALCVLEQVQQELAALRRPTALRSTGH